MAKKEQAIEVKKENSLSTENNYDVSGFMAGGLSITDIKIQKILITQPMSTVKNENDDLRDGDLYLSVEKACVLPYGKELSFTPLFVEKLLQIFENKTKIPTFEGSKKGDWVKTEAVTSKNANLPKVDEGYVRMYIKAMYIHVVSEGFNSVIPLRLNFKGSSADAFQPIIEKIIKHAEETGSKIPQLDLVFKLHVTKKINKAGQTFFVLNVAYDRLSTEAEKLKAIKMLEMVQSLSVEEKYNDSDEIPNFAE
jgi:hypothetical protein